VALASASAQAQPALPKGFVRVSEAVPGVQLDVRYLGSNNFLGRPVAGYEGAQCILTREAAQALAGVQAELRGLGLSLKLFDCFRPQRAVDDFVAWSHDAADVKTRERFYPGLNKPELFEKGYIAAKSGHSRGSTVDLTLVKVSEEALRHIRGPLKPDGEVDMGGEFDFFGELSHTDNPTLPEAVRHNRALLKGVMARHGFVNLPEEWWHYTLRPEPFPQTYFDFPVR
jgi:D-alanyl-D-alanine dipeptidase